MLWAFSLSPPNLMPLTAFSVHPAINLCWQLCRSIPLFFNPGPQNFTGSHPSDIPLFNRLSNYPVCISSWDKPTHYKVSLISFFLGWCASPFSFFGARETPNRAFITLLCLPFAYLWWYLSGMPDRGNRSLKELTQIFIPLLVELALSPSVKAVEACRIGDWEISKEGATLKVVWLPEIYPLGGGYLFVLESWWDC